MEKKSMYALIAAIVVVVPAVVVAGLYMLMNGGGGGGSGTKTTYTVSNATSLQTEANVTERGITVTHQWFVKNLNTTQQMLRLNILGGEAGNYSYIFITNNQTVWFAQNGVWTDVSSTFDSLWSVWGTHWNNLRNELITNWSGSGEHDYTASDGSSVRVHYVSVNPSLADSLFQPNT